MAFFSFPKLHLGTQLLEQLYCEVAEAQLLAHQHSQVQLGNERKRRLQALTILFGGKTDCDEFTPFGDVVQLEDITD